MTAASWVLQVVGVVLNIFIAYAHDTKKIYGLTFLFNLANLLLYFVTRDWGAAVSGTLITVRSLAYIFKERIPGDWLPWVFSALHIVLGTMAFESPWQLCIIVAPVAICFAMWFWKGQFQKLRVGNIINATLWMVYNFHMGLYLIGLCRFATVVANGSALWKNRKPKEMT